MSIVHEHLLPCPFCGGKAELHEIRSEAPDYPFGAKVECADCQVKRFALATTQKDAAEKAIEDWSQRLPLPEEYKVRLAHIQLRHNGITRDPASPGTSFQGALMGIKSETSLLRACIQCPLCQRWVSLTHLITDIDNWLNCGFTVRMCNRATYESLSPFYRKSPMEMEEGDYGHDRKCRLFRLPKEGSYGDFGVDRVPLDEFVTPTKDNP